MGTKLRSVTIRVEHELWDRVVARAREERRPTAQLLRILVADAVECEGKCGPAADDLDGFEDALAERLQVQFR